METTSRCLWVLIWLNEANNSPSDAASPQESCLTSGRKEMFYLTTHSTHFIYGYMASDIWLRTILIVRKETCCRHIGYYYRLTARVLLYAPSHRQDSTYHSLCYTSHGALAGTRNSSMGPPWRVDLTTHRTMSERSYHGATSRSSNKRVLLQHNASHTQIRAICWCCCCWQNTKPSDQNSIQLGFNTHVQSKLLWHTPVMGTHSNYQVCCLSSSW